MTTKIKTIPSQWLKLKDGRKLELSYITPEKTDALITFLETIGNQTTQTLQYPGRNYSSYTIEQRINRTVESQVDLLLAVEFEGKIIAHLDFQVQNETHPWIKHIARFGLAVLEENQRLGIGTALIKNMEKWARSIPITRIETLVQTNNNAGLSLCKENGFELEGLRQNSIFIDNEYKDEFYLAKII